MKKEKVDLTDRQKKFCELYRASGNATKAALEAGYTKKYAGRAGYDNLHNPKISQYLEMLGKSEKKKRIASADEVLEYLSSLVRGDPQGDDEHQAEDAVRIRAAELLGKRYALYIDKSESKSDERLIVEIKEVE